MSRHLRTSDYLTQSSRLGFHLERASSATTEPFVIPIFKENGLCEHHEWIKQEAEATDIA